MRDGDVALGKSAGGRHGEAQASVAPPTNQRITFQIHRVNAKIAQVANPLFRIHKLDLVSSRILVLLLERDAVRVGELVDLMVLPQSTISHQLQRLEKRGLLGRRRAAEDNRAVAVSLTRKGRGVAAECNRLSLSVFGHIAASLTSEEQLGLGRLLAKMFAALDSFDGKTAAAAARGRT